jgi:hypothetical protein
MEDVAAAKFRVSALNLLAAISKLLRVRVEGSKNKFATTCPCKVGTFLVLRDRTSLNEAAVCKTALYSSVVKSDKERM